MLIECFNRDIEGGCIPECRACDDCKGKAYKLIDREHLKERIHNYVHKLNETGCFSDHFLDITIEAAFDIIKIIDSEYAYTLYDDRGEQK